MSDVGACWRCMWFVHDKDAENAETGWCYRYPPQMVVGDGECPTTGWLPPVTFLSFCGEFKEADGQ